jgi:putative phage-type endonuclease
VSFTPAELEARRATLGASEVPAVAGLSPWASAIGVYESKVYGLHAPPNAATEVGDLLEEPIAEIYARRTGRTLVRMATITHERHPWLSATPDRLVHGEARLVEIKAVGIGTAPRWGDDEDEIPDYVRAQVEIQMEVTGLGVCDVIALIGTEPRIYTIRRDRALAADLVEIGHAFWHAHVVARVPPTMDGSDDADGYLARRFPRPLNDDLLPMPLVAIPWLDELRAAKADGAAAKARADHAGNVLRALIGAGAGFEDETYGRVTWTKNDSGGVDWKALAEETLDRVCLKGNERTERIGRFALPGARVLREQMPKAPKARRRDRT